MIAKFGFLGCVCLCVCWHAMGRGLSRVVCLFPELPARENSERNDRMEDKPYVTFFFGWELAGSKKKKRRKKISARRGLCFSNWKQASVKRITSQKPKIIRWDKEARRREERKRECETVREMNISGDGGFHSVWRGLRVNLHQQSHLCAELWLRREGEEEERRTRKIKAS